MRHLRKHDKVDTAMGGFWAPRGFKGYQIESWEEAVQGSERRVRSSYYEAPARRMQMVFQVRRPCAHAVHMQCTCSVHAVWVVFQVGMCHGVHGVHTACAHGMRSANGMHTACAPHVHCMCTACALACTPHVHLPQVKGAAKDGLVSFEAYKRSGDYHFDMLSVDIDNGEPAAPT